MERVVQPERVVCSRAWLAVLLGVVGILVVVGLSSWVVRAALATWTVSDFRDLVFFDVSSAQRRGLPGVRVLFGREELIKILTQVKGTEEDPRNEPQIKNADWAVSVCPWQDQWLYDGALAWWQDARPNLMRIDELQRTFDERTATIKRETDRGAQADQALIATNRRQQLDFRKQQADLAGKSQTSLEKAYGYLQRAIDQNKADGFYRYVRAQLLEAIQKNRQLAAFSGTQPDVLPPMTDQAAVQANWRLAEDRPPGNTAVFVGIARHEEAAGNREAALNACRQALEHVETEILAGLGSPNQNQGLLGQTYLNDILGRYLRWLPDYEAFARYLPDDPQVHYRAARFLEANGKDQWAASEWDKVLSSGQAVADQGRQTGVTLMLMSDAAERRGDLDKAIELTAQAVRLDPGQVDWCLLLASRKTQRAEQLGRDALKLVSTDTAQAGILRDRAYKLFKEADEAADKILTRDQASKGALDLRKRIRDLQAELKI